MKRFRLTRKQTEGIGRGMVEESVVELADAAKPPEGAEAVADTAELHDWREVAAENAPHVPAPGSGGITSG